MKQSTRRLLAYGSNATLVSVLVFVMLVGLYLLAHHERIRVDMSEASENTLSVETLEKLALLDMEGAPIEITAFSFQRGAEESAFKDRAVRDLLREIGFQSDVIEWEHIDFDQERLTADQLGVREYGHIVVRRGEDRVDIRARELFQRVGRGVDQHTEFVGEDAVSRALAQLMSDSRRVAYVLEGHGEMSPDDLDLGGMSDWAAALADERYDLRGLNLIGSSSDAEFPSIPDDAALLVIARPSTSLSEHAEGLLLSWVAAGGPVLFLMDTDSVAPTLLDLLGVAVGDGVVMQEEHLVGYPSWPIPQAVQHSSTSEIIESELVTLMADPVPLMVLERARDQARINTILRTRRGAWIERGGEHERYDPDSDERVEGNLNLGIALEVEPGAGLVRAGKPAARVVIFADADMMSNRLVTRGPGNLTLARDTVHWLVGDDRRLGITGAVGQSRQVRRLALTQQELGWMRWISMALMPLMVAFIGGLVWMGRRGR